MVKKTGCLLALLAFLISCEKEPCQHTFCKNGGTCIEGNCKCSKRYEGKNCGKDKCAGLNCERGTKEYRSNECVCNCPEGYKGNHCRKEKNPSAITIQKIKLIEFPAKVNTNSGKEEKPDLYLRLRLPKKNQIKWIRHNEAYTNASPLKNYTYDDNYPITTKRIEEKILVEVCHVTGVASCGRPYYDYIEKLEFIPYLKGNGFPQSITVEKNAVKLKVFFSYKFN